MAKTIKASLTTSSKIEMTGSISQNRSLYFIKRTRNCFQPPTNNKILIDYIIYIKWIIQIFFNKIIKNIKELERNFKKEEIGKAIFSNKRKSKRKKIKINLSKFNNF
jgi:hypothetical protein